ncbi:hypothetical protein QMS56_07690 [Cronobacter malonaticus]|uniref:Cytoplasmic protein n=1 Tax=Cronobacter malonaticus TaxID=413503 RepID=A0ABX5JVY2_9ENTR|nr:hypothetical protein [Cronobacter malonaticus]CCJ92388.1 FIG00553918: hypothetical protein [Cronobacter malonaticus 681]ALX77235.1 hypothetical protein AFK66_002945 [Cronobacter malonaticus LMG 23826]EGT4278946.1 hypothetical protein [Cronobacter malonaticus]EGT4288305.1 hypothetical protein [Cronobacter malonaticus]EGT4296063.1 hypothetical protein [Cronobacter malonaticus]
MLPDNLVPARYRIPTPDNHPSGEQNSENLTQGKPKLEEYETDILSGKSLAGQSGNVLLEERDRHIKARLLSVVKIEAYTKVLNNLVEDNAISAEELAELIATKTAQINEAGNKIWLNLITQEKDAPVFYKLED